MHGLKIARLILVLRKIPTGLVCTWLQYGRHRRRHYALHQVQKKIEKPISIAWVVLQLFMGLAVFLILVGYSKFIPNGIALLLFSGTFVATLTISLLLAFRRAKVLGRKLRAGDGKFCTRCGYDLNDLGETGHCPECGDSFVITEVQKSWSGLMAL